MSGKVVIIILNWNNWKDTLECLSSLSSVTYHEFDIIIVDNASQDNSIQKLKEYFEEESHRHHVPGLVEVSKNKTNSDDHIFSSLSVKNIILIKNEKNYGFAEGNNIGIRFALRYLNPDYMLLLNNDTVVDREFLQELIKAAEMGTMDHRKIGFLGPKNYYYTKDGRSDIINFAGGKVNLWLGHSMHIGEGEIDQQQFEIVSEVDFITGACMLVKREVLESVGLLDPAFFLYWEDTDWCFRGKKAGYASVYVPQAKIWHKIGISASGNTNRYYVTRNRFLFMKKNASFFQRISFLLYFFTIVFLGNIIVYGVVKRDRTLLYSFLRGARDGFRILIWGNPGREERRDDELPS